jgi:putative addiction module CopG family antidote
MNVSLGKLEAWVKDQVKQGDYDSHTEVVREAVRRMKLGTEEPQHLQKAMDQAEASGFEHFNLADWQMLRRLARTGKHR